MDTAWTQECHLNRGWFCYLRTKKEKSLLKKNHYLTKSGQTYISLTILIIWGYTVESELGCFVWSANHSLQFMSSLIPKDVSNLIYIYTSYLYYFSIIYIIPNKTLPSHTYITNIDWHTMSKPPEARSLQFPDGEEGSGHCKVCEISAREPFRSVQEICPLWISKF